MNQRLFRGKSHKRQEQNYQFACDVCGRQFTQKEYLSRHNKIHNSALFQCDFCTYRSATKQNILRHQVRHTSNKLYQCPDCQHWFSFHSNLVRHQKKCRDRHLMQLRNAWVVESPFQFLETRQNSQTPLEQQLCDRLL